MKVRVKKIIKFQPIELEIIIEDESELIDLWHRFNIGNSDIQDIIEKRGCKQYDTSPYSRNPILWKEINKLVDDLDLKNKIYNC